MEPMEKKMKRKEERENCAGKLLKEKGNSMSRQDKSFVEMFAKKKEKKEED